MTSKVRIACRRCRAKRIKCDGGIPACSNCQKACEICLDVDGRNNSISIPRDFAANARARIDWLEEQLRRHAPHVNMDEGPKVDLRFQEATNPGEVPETMTVETEDTASPPKRNFAATQEQVPHDQPFATEARSVALDLGLLSLSSDSRQLHYLGTSSGRLFTSLIGLGSPETMAQARAGNTPSIYSQPSPSGKPVPFAHAKRLKESCRLVYETLRKSLPAREDAQILLDTYLRSIHVEHPFLHPGSLVNAIEALYQCATAEPSAELGFNGWVTTIEPFAYNGEFSHLRGINKTPISIFTATFHVFMAFTLAATIRTRQRMYDFAPDQFYRVATSVAHHCLSNTSVATLQAILLAAVHSLLTPTEVNIWTLTYTAMAQCIDLGLHRMPKSGDDISAAAILTRKMVFFSVYHLDRSVATIQGRPLGIRDETFDVQLPSLQDVQADAADLGSSDLVPGTSIPAIVSFSIHRFKLDPIISEIKLLFYHLPGEVSFYSWPADHHSTQNAIRQRLETWRRELHSVACALRHDAADADDQAEIRRYELKVKSQFFAAMILLYQPSQIIPHPSEDALLICYQCAASRINTYNSLHNAEGFFQSWRSVHGVFSSGATMIYCLWTSSSVQRSVPLSTAMTDLRTCTNLLSVGGEWWPSVKRGKETIGRAIDALVNKFDRSKTSWRSQESAREMGEGPVRNIRRQSERDAVYFETLPTASIQSSAGGLLDQINTSLPSSFDEASHANYSIDHGTTDWGLLNTSGDPSPQFDLHNLDNNMFGTGPLNMDNTVEAFITEFLQNDATFNPF
ncbi:hypothetical protein PMIN06_005884 [Paraphaeosphaeria minitans]